MRTASKIRCLVILLGLVGSYAAAHAQDVVLVAIKSVHMSEIKDDDLRAIFIGTKTRLADGSHVAPVILKGGPAHEVFLKNHIGKGPVEFRAQWRKAVFTGQGAMPKTFNSELAVIEYVAATPGAIGYVSRVLPNDNVKYVFLVKR